MKSTSLYLFFLKNHLSCFLKKIEKILKFLTIKYMSIINEPQLSRNNHIVEPPTLNNNSVNCIFFFF